MHFKFSAFFALSLLPFVLPLATVASPANVKLGARTFNSNMTSLADNLEKRANKNARLTWYDVSVGVTACGKSYSNDLPASVFWLDLVVHMS
ncbi:hypothetical protein EW145_g3814 [Phellinidium pouzarii]|uniref:SCP domain-containing protein n=1 Tax=Phellinidium pouzarii TaxID=167371 RepID=A0A4S4LB01_9AGAM|nr:hypothetical protein EW145_g3814 [Phellinidium pouzarii]